MEAQMSVSINYKKRVLEAGDKAEMLEKGQVSFKKERVEGVSKIQAGEGSSRRSQRSRNQQDTQNLEKKGQKMITDDTDDSQNSAETDTTELERQAYTRRNRVAKKRKGNQLDALENKRPKRKIRRYDQQNKQETLLDKDETKINENIRSILNKYENETECATNFEGFSKGVRGSLEKCQDSADNIRKKSEGAFIIARKPNKKTWEIRLPRNLSENRATNQSESMDILDTDCKLVETLETSQKDSDKSIPRQLSLESPEKAAASLIQQTTIKEEYAGTLKTEDRIEKERKKDKRRSRLSLKKEFKRVRGDDEVDKPEYFYIIQKSETSDREDSGSGANLKFSANHRHSCDEDNEDTAPKDRQSLVIPERSSSFSIHPGRLCADVCCYCFIKFGSLETPMHLAQMKSDERRQRILDIERHLTKESCLCDACYRHVSRMAYRSPTNMQTKLHRKLIAPTCSVGECKDAARYLVKRRWLLKIKAGLQKQVDIDWESSQQTSMSFCISHHSIIERLLICALCKHRMTRHHIYQLPDAEIDKLNQLHQEQRFPVILESGSFVCKLCRYFTQLQLTYKDVENMNKNRKSFFKSYRKRVLHYRDIEVVEIEDEDSTQNQTKDKDEDKDRRRKMECNTQPKAGTSNSPDGTINSVSEKSIPEPIKIEGPSSEMDNDNRTAKANLNDENVAMDLQFHGIESTAVKLEDQKLLDMYPYTSDAIIPSDDSNLLVDLLAMDKEVTYRSSKRSRRNEDVTQVVQRLDASPSINARIPLLCKEEKDLHDNIEFTSDRETTPEVLANCDATIQCDRDTKLLSPELQKPHWHSKYFSCVQNHLIACEFSEITEEPITEPIASEYHNSRRLSGGYVLERDEHTLPSTSTPKQPLSTSTTQSIISSSPQVLELNPGVRIIEDPLPNLQELNLPSTSASPANGNVRQMDDKKLLTSSSSSGGKVFRLFYSEFFKIKILIEQLEHFLEKVLTSSVMKSMEPYYKAQIAEFRKLQKLLKNDRIFKATNRYQEQVNAIIDELQLDD